MIGLLTGIGAKLAERWAATVVLPGLLYVAVLAAAAILGHRDALDAARLVAEVNTLASATLAVAAMAAATGAGLLAGALGAGIERCWHLTALSPVPDRLTRRRQARWKQADDRAGENIVVDARTRTGALSPATLAALARRDKIALEPPTGPFGIGDRLRAAATRLDRAYRVPLRTIWPALWLTLPDATRAEIDASRTAHAAAARAGGWAILYLLAGVLWWPAAIAALILGVMSVIRGRLTVTTFAELIEAAADCHLRDLATRLGLSGSGPLTPADGEAMTALLGKQTR
ncbi:hypothetical protein [Actinoplanes sp. NBRC 103695]|uniref:hypothetical protein n=1 Tax=Actinoplanes sp. NBRC 103695 TaxID=3032202 RepID=UPI0024A550AC|nr:hypothetical protein [Actinoplanes sp. NBRC 103695]GLY94455.1 hypothetical protein Acsp02_17110 [Actinoplanes sp. NBRC 103695]